MTKHIVFDCDGTLMDTSRSRYSLFPGIKELIIELSATCELYVWTARDRASTIRYLQEFEIYKYFNSVCTIDDAEGKPHIEGLKLLLGDAAKNSICVIGDTSNDILGAKNFGVLGIGAAWAQDVRVQNLKHYGADFIVSDPAECSTLIKQNLKES